MKTIIITLAAMGGIVLLLFASVNQCSADILSQGEMQKVIGGGCSVCENFCSGNGCSGKCEKGDLNEFCGASTGEGTAYGCMAGGNENSNCTTTGNDSSCTNEQCHCGNGTTCYKDQTATKQSGKSECSD